MDKAKTDLNFSLLSNLMKKFKNPLLSQWLRGGGTSEPNSEKL